MNRNIQAQRAGFRGAAVYQVMGMIAIFTYDFPVAKEAFKKANVELITLSNYQTILDVALASGYISENEMETLQDWRKAPAEWGKK